MLNEMMAYMHKHWVITKRWPGETATIIFHPFIGLLSIGLFALFMSGPGGSADALLFVMVGVISWNFYDLSQRAVTHSVAFDIWANCLKHSYTTSARTRHFIAGNALWGIMISFFSLVTVGLVGLLAFGVNIFSGGVFLVVNMLSIFMFALGVGMALDFLMLCKGVKWMSLIWMTTGIFMIFSGVYYPIDVLPWPAKAISLVMPPTHSIISLRAAMGLHDAGLVMPEMLLGLALSAFFLVLGSFLYKLGVEKGKENGLITKF